MMNYVKAIDTNDAFKFLLPSPEVCRYKFPGFVTSIFDSLQILWFVIDHSLHAMFNFTEHIIFTTLINQWCDFEVSWKSNES